MLQNKSRRSLVLCDPDGVVSIVLLGVRLVMMMCRCPLSHAAPEKTAVDDVRKKYYEYQ